MKNLFEEEAIVEIKNRIEKLNNKSQPNWGKMNVAQMLAHCTKALDMATGKINPPRIFAGRLLGPFFKSTYHNEKPFAKGSPTVKLIEVIDERDFNKEKDSLKFALDHLEKGGEYQFTLHPHPFFGHFSPLHWSTGMYKHLDHHLRQFGV